MPTAKQRRHAAQRHLQRQLERRAELARRRRRNVGIIATVLAVVVVVGDFAPDSSGNPNLTAVGPPPDADHLPAEGTSTLLMATNHGELTLTLDRAKAPCAAASFTYLAAQKFFDGSTCHQ